MPVYNGECYIKQSIDSVLNQTLSNFELIIVDDGSTDNTKRIIQEYGDTRIKYVYQKNGGVGSALAYGCSIARGRYIARLDADDLALPSRFEEQFNFLEENPDYVLVASAVEYINSEGCLFGRSFPIDDYKIIDHDINTGGVPVFHPSVMFRLSAYMKTGGYRPIEPFEDWDLWRRIIKYGKFKNINKILIKYRYLGTSVSSSINIEQWFVLFNVVKSIGYGHDKESIQISFYRDLYKLIKTINKITCIHETNVKRDTSVYVNMECKLYGLLRIIMIESWAANIICNVKKTFKKIIILLSLQKTPYKNYLW